MTIKLYLNGEKVRDGNIQAAEFINRGKSFRAIRFTDNNNHTDYYEPNGKSLRKTFLPRWTTLPCAVALIGVLLGAE